MDALQEIGVRAFLDERTIQYGEPIDEILVTGLRQCDTVVMIISENSIKSDWVKYEIGAAWALDKYIVPVMLTKENPPIPATRLKYLDATIDQFTARDEIVRLFKRRYSK